jgi:hypothetical protein
MFYLDVAYTLQWFFKSFYIFLQVFQHVCFKCLIYLLLYVANIALDVSKVDQVLHMGCAWKWEGTRAVPRDVQHGPPRGKRNAGAGGDIRAAQALTWTRETEAQKQTVAMDVRPAASSAIIQNIGD